MTTSAIFAPPGGGVLVASASTAFREQVRHSLDNRRGPVQEVLGGAEALVKLESGDWQVLFLDRRLPDLDTEELIQIIRRRFPGIEVVLLDSASGQALPMPGGDANSVPYAAHRVKASSARDNFTAKVSPWPSTLPAAVPVEPLPGMIGGADSMQHAYRLARLVAPRTTTVLILGPTGTGKELLARAIHQLSPRAARPLVVVNCAAIPEALLESELFGHTRGAFTGALQASTGRIPAAHGGTLFLDEVGELALSLQAKLLRFIEHKEVQRLGSAEVMRIDVRIVAATNADLARRVEENKFRGDLYYRLSAFPVELPPLRGRGADIALLAEYFLERISAASATAAPELSLEVVRILESQPWEGNVRELQQVMERAYILCDGESAILPRHLYFFSGGRQRVYREAALPAEL